MAKVAPTDSPTVVEPPSVPSTNTPNLPTKSDFPSSDHHPHPSYSLIHNPSPVYQNPSLHESTRDPPIPANSQPDLPPRDDPTSSDPPQPRSPHTPDTHPASEPKDHLAHHHLPPTTPDPEVPRHPLPVPQPQNGQPIMGVIASFNDLNLGPQLPYAGPPPMHMLPIHPQPVLPLVPPQHPSHISAHQPHPHHHPPAHKHHHQTHLLPSTFCLWVPQDRVGAVIGGHGAVIRSLQEKSGATIQVHNDTVRGDLKLFTISGTPAQYDIARQLINDIVEKPRQSHSGHGPHSSADRPPFSPGGDHSARVGDVWKTVYVPTTCVGLVIGRNGETIRNLQDRSGAEIKVTPDEEAPPDSETRSILISGTEDAIATAHQLISEIVMDARSRRPPQSGPQVGTSINGQPVVLEVLTIPNEKVGLIIGKRGAAIRELQSKSGAKIQVTKDESAIQSDGSRPVTITGIRQHVDEAKAMIANKINMPLMTSPPVTPVFNNPSQPGGAASMPPATGPSHQPPYMMPNVYDPTFQNGQQPFPQMYDPNDPAAQNRAMAYFQYIGYNNYAMAQQRQFQNQMPLHYGHPSPQVPQEPTQPGLQAPHQEGQDAMGQQSQFAAPTMQQGQAVEAVQNTPGVMSRDPNGNVVMYPPHYTPPAPHIGPHQLYNSGPPNPRMFSRREHVQAAHHHAHAQMMMQAHAHAHAHAVQAHAQAQANAHAEAEAEAETQARQQQPQTPTISATTEDNEQPNG